MYTWRGHCGLELAKALFRDVKSCSGGSARCARTKQHQQRCRAADLEQVSSSRASELVHRIGTLRLAERHPPSIVPCIRLFGYGHCRWMRCDQSWTGSPASISAIQPELGWTAARPRAKRHWPTRWRSGAVQHEPSGRARVDRRFPSSRPQIPLHSRELDAASGRGRILARRARQGCAGAGSRAHHPPGRQ